MSKKTYAVVVGRVPGLYDLWDGPKGAKAQVDGLTNAVYKGFQSRSEAIAWYKARAGGAEPADYTTRVASAEDAALPDYFALHQQAIAAGRIVIYTDGGAIGNPGPGGYGAVLLHRERRKELSGGFALTTNNRMELMACIMALETLKQPSNPLIFCDSAYVVDSLKYRRPHKWRANQWLRDEGEPVANPDLWARLLVQTERHTIEWVRLKGHAGSKENDRCHALADAAQRQANLPPDEGYAK